MERREPNTKARGRVVAVALAASLVPVMGGGADGLWTPQLHGQGDTHEAMSALVAQADPQQQIGDDLDADATYEGDVTVTSPLSLNGHTLTVTGSLVARADVDLGGGTLAVGGTYAQDSGQLTVGAGSLSVGGDLRFQSVSYDGDGLPSYGSCGSHFVMQDAAGRVEVAGDLWSNSNYMDVEGDRSAGTLSVAGDVRHDDQYRFVTDDGLTVVLAGEGQHEVSLLPKDNGSRIGRLRAEGPVRWTGAMGLGALEGDMLVEGDAEVTSNLGLAAGQTLTVAGSLVARADVDLGGGTLAVGGTYAQDSGQLTVGAGSLSVGGDLRFQSVSYDGEGRTSYGTCDSRLVMQDAAGRVEVAGGLLSNSNYMDGEGDRSAGTLSVAGDVRHDSFYRFVTDDGLTVVLAGAGEHEVSLLPKDNGSRIGRLRAEGPVRWTGAMGLGALEGDMLVESDAEVTSNLGLAAGQTLTVAGSLVARADVDLGGGTLAVGGTYAQDSGQLTVGAGSLSVGGDLRFQSVSYDGDGLPSYGSCGSHFVMQDAAGRVEVAGDLWSNSNYMDVEGDRSAGTLSVAGDVRHDDQYRFVTDDGLTVVLAGEGQHEVSLVSNGDDSCIGHLRLSQSMNMYSFNPNPCWNTLDIDLGRAVVAVEQQGITYDGMAKEPEVTVTLTGTKLSADNDYTVAYSNNVNAGTATITVTGVGEYVGTATGTFRIEPKTVSSATVTLSPKSYTYDGTAKKPTVSVTDGTKTLVAGTDYEVSYKNNKNAGKATAIVTGKGNYRDTKSAKFTIAAKSLSGATVTLSPTSYTYDGTVKEPSVTVKDGSKTLVAGTDYEVSYEGNVNVGTATATVTGKGNYKDTKSASFSIAAKPLSSCEVTLSPTSYDYDGTAKEPAVTVTDGTKTLVAGTDYEVSYSDNVNVGTATATVTGKGNYKDTKSANFVIAAKSLSGATITFSPKSYTYDGTAKEPTVTVKDGTKTLVAGTDYKVSYKNNTNAGKATATVTGKGNYKDTKSASFSIAAKPLSSCEVTLSPTSYDYDGTAKEPSVTVKDGSKTLVAGTDYEVSYSDNVNVGTATATVTGKGNYKDTKSATFTIAQGQAADGWVDLPGGKKGYRKNGALVKGWLDLGSSKYYFLDDNSMALGWNDVESDGKVMHYYFNPASGNLVRDTWFKIDGKTYYFRPSGNLATGWATISDNGVDKKYFLDENGQLLTGWQDIEVNGKVMHYYFRPSGAMATGWATIDGHNYWFRPSGNMATGFTDVDDGYKRYFDEQGHMVTGWMSLGSNTYYFRSSGAMQTGTATIGGVEYTFSDKGVLIES